MKRGSLDNACRETGWLFLRKTKNDIIQGADELGKNGVTSWQANSTGMPPSQKRKQRRVTNLFLNKH